MVSFWAKVKTTLFMFNYCVYFVGNFFEKIGLLLIQHLVTLDWEVITTTTAAVATTAVDVFREFQPSKHEWTVGNWRPAFSHLSFFLGSGNKSEK